MEAYLQGQDLWELISDDETVIPVNTPQNAELRRKWKIKCGRALFALRTSISKEYIEHVREEKSPKQVWDTLEKLFTQKNTMRLQYLENELAGMTQGNLSISEYFLKIKNLCAEISELDKESPLVMRACVIILFAVCERSLCRLFLRYKGGQISLPSLSWRICSQIMKNW